MSNYEEFYLALVVIGFVVFAAALGAVVWSEDRRLNHKK